MAENLLILSTVDARKSVLLTSRQNLLLGIRLEMTAVLDRLHTQGGQLL